jgi:hypothetical protein
MRLFSPPPRVNTHASPALHQREGKRRLYTLPSPPADESKAFDRFLNTAATVSEAYSFETEPKSAVPQLPITPPVDPKDPYALIEQIEDLLGNDLEKELKRLPNNLNRFRNDKPIDFNRIETFFGNRIGSICDRLGMTLDEIRYPHRLGLYSGRLQRLLNALTRLHTL